MAEMNGQREWAKLGAAARLAQLDTERAAILKIFPDLGRKGASVAAVTFGKPKRRFSSAARRRMSAGMRKYWARRKAAAAKA